MALHDNNLSLGKPVFNTDAEVPVQRIEIVDPQVVRDLKLQVVLLTNQLNALYSNKFIRFFIWLNRLFT